MAELEGPKCGISSETNVMGRRRGNITCRLISKFQLLRNPQISALRRAQRLKGSVHVRICAGSVRRIRSWCDSACVYPYLSCSRTTTQRFSTSNTVDFFKRVDSRIETMSDNKEYWGKFYSIVSFKIVSVECKKKHLFQQTTKQWSLWRFDDRE